MRTPGPVRDVCVPLGAVATLVWVAFLPAARAQPTDATGRLDVMSAPLGEVVVDGHPTGRRTPVHDLTVPPGPHQVAVRFERTGRTAAAQKVTVRPAKTSHLYFRDRPADEDLAAACRKGEEEACWLRALAKVEAGDESDAIPLLEAYLRDFPEGAYAGVARALLDAARADVARPAADAPGADRAAEGGAAGWTGPPLVWIAGLAALALAVAGLGWWWRRPRA